MRHIMVAAALLLTGCATTSEMPLAPNVVRLDTQASGLAFVGSVGEVTMLRAAEATVKRGYTHFRFQDASTAQGSRVVGVSGQASGFGSASTLGNRTSSTFTGTSYQTPIYAPTAAVGVTVVMFRAGEPGFEGAWEAADVIARKGKV